MEPRIIEAHDCWGDKALWEFETQCCICGQKYVTSVRTTRERLNQFAEPCPDCTAAAEE